MSMWVISMDKFSKVYKVVEPKIKRKEAAEAELKEVMTVLRQKQKELAAVEAKIQGLRDSLEEKQREFQVIQDNVDLTYGRINRAGRLTSSLPGRCSGPLLRTSRMRRRCPSRSSGAGPFPSIRI